MAKASAQITISRIVDISSVTRYYLLQSSTSAAPSKPTANPPGGSWTTTEPTYTSGSTNTLYFVDLTVFSNSNFSYSNVSKSSSYEAAKTAYNKALDAAKTATNYMKFENNTGLIVGNMTGNTLGKNVLIDSDSVDIRDGTTVAASFSANSINLGRADSSSTVNLCGNAGTISARSYDDTNVFDSLEINSRNIDIVAPNTYMRTHSRVNSNGYANSVIQATTGNIVSGDSYAGDYSLASISSNSTSSNTSHASVSTTAFADHADASSVNINAVNGSLISNIEVTPTNIKLKTGAGEIIADSHMVFNKLAEFCGDVLFNKGFEADGSVKFNVGSQYVQFETDGSYPGIATANYIRTPTSGIIPKTSGGSGSIGTSGWPFNNGYFNNLYVNGTAVSVSGHTHSYLPLSGGTLTSSSFGGSLNIKRSGSTSGAAIKFENTNGVLGYIGMKDSPDGGLYRYGTNTNNKYLVLDSGNTGTFFEKLKTRTGGTVTSASISSSTSVTEKSLFTAPANGFYFINAFANYSTNATGIRFAQLSCQQGGTQVGAGSGHQVQIYLTEAIYLASGTAVKLKLRQNSGSTLTCEYNWRYTYIPM